MRAAQLDGHNYVINFAEVASFGFPFIDPTGLNIGDHVIDGVVQPKSYDELEVIRQEKLAAIQSEIDGIERNTYLNRGSRELELVSIQDLATRQATVLQPSMPDKTVEQITAAILAARPYYVKLVALNDQVTALRTAMAAL